MTGPKRPTLVPTLLGSFVVALTLGRAAGALAVPLLGGRRGLRLLVRRGLVPVRLGLAVVLRWVRPDRLDMVSASVRWAMCRRPVPPCRMRRMGPLDGGAPVTVAPRLDRGGAERLLIGLSHRGLEGRALRGRCGGRLLRSRGRGRRRVLGRGLQDRVPGALVADAGCEQRSGTERGRLEGEPAPDCGA